MSLSFIHLPPAGFTGGGSHLIAAYSMIFSKKTRKETIFFTIFISIIYYLPQSGTPSRLKESFGRGEKQMPLMPK